MGRPPAQLVHHAHPAAAHCPSAAAAKPKPRELRGYTRAEVAQHKAEDDLWLIIKNKGSDRLKVRGPLTRISFLAFLAASAAVAAAGAPRTG